MSQKYTQVRKYVDLSGEPRVLRRIMGGNYVHWHKEHAACWSTIWWDEVHGGFIQIPDNAWEKLGMSYEDNYEVKECGADSPYGSGGRRGKV